jgi:hypothetical protein
MAQKYCSALQMEQRKAKNPHKNLDDPANEVGPSQPHEPLQKSHTQLHLDKKVE